MKTLALFFVSSLISISAFADFNGTWHGKGNYADGEGYTEMCPTMNLELIQQPTEFAISSGAFECESLKVGISGVTFKVQEGEILDKDGNYLGSVDDSYFFAKAVDPETQWTSAYQIELTPDGMEYKQTTIDDGGNIVFTIDGVFQK